VFRSSHSLADNGLQIGDVADFGTLNLILTENPAILPMCCYAFGLSYKLLNNDKKRNRRKQSS
jgi:hypothetical protein